ncbi:hypothetical protein CAEBREN_21064 [Caenorhabditis brenneri]|uniref:DUF38 domain-containing protein n=1 Tax=Caenorhabditis brenneri TaxID=135651 RepID=G0N1G4_CAEBE|nr:hypothetical protein CAEBREN_21064 [Caenorhabditis brenneri]
MGNILSWLSNNGDDGTFDGFPLVTETSTLAFHRALGIKPNSKITQVLVHAHGNSISLALEFSESQKSQIVFENQEENDQKGCLVTHEKSKKFLESLDFLEVFWEIFEVILRTQKSILETFEIAISEFEEDKIFNNILKTLAYRSTQLPVQNFIFKSEKSEIFPRVLRFLNPEVLKSIIISDPKNQLEKLDLSEISSLEQWKKAEEIQIHGYDLEMKVENFENFTKLNFAIKRISMDDLKTWQKDSENLNLVEIFGKPTISQNILGETERK